VWVACVDTLLHHTATMLVTSNFDTLIVHSIKDELVVKRVPRVQDFLDNMVAVYVFGENLNVVFKLVDNQSDLMSVFYYFDKLLDGSSSMGTLTQAYRILRDMPDQRSQVIFTSLFS
jgi:hypothetical protein